jgi:hypothetical protein
VDAIAEFLLHGMFHHILELPLVWITGIGAFVCCVKAWEKSHQIDKTDAGFYWVSGGVLAVITALFAWALQQD